MLLYRLICVPLLILSLIALSACTPDASRPRTALAPASAETYFPLKVGGTTLHLQLALSQSEQARGLMFRDNLEQDHGMLFVFNEPAPRAFWMRNTPLKLDLAYLDVSGTVLEIHKLYPYSETTVPSRSQAVQFVIEMDRGWFAANQVGVGAQLNLAAVAEAISARGRKPADFGL